MAEFIYVVRPPRPTFIEDSTDEEQQAVAAHFRYLQGLLAAGSLIIAGRTAGGEFGICVFEAEDEARARVIVDADPAVQAGVFTAELFPYRVALLRGR